MGCTSEEGDHGDEPVVARVASPFGEDDGVLGVRGDVFGGSVYVPRDSPLIQHSRSISLNPSVEGVAEKGSDGNLAG